MSLKDYIEEKYAGMSIERRFQVALDSLSDLIVRYKNADVETVDEGVVDRMEAALAKLEGE